MDGKWLGCIQPMCSAPGHSWQGRAVGQITRADIIDDGEWYDVKVPDGPHHKNLTKVLNPNPDYSYP